jgi:hypothetical protein
MSYPGPGPICRHCIVCGRPFRVWKCELLRNRAKFCTRKCYSVSRRLFSKALADGRLELILANEIERWRRAGRRRGCPTVHLKALSVESPPEVSGWAAP